MKKKWLLVNNFRMSGNLMKSGTWWSGCWQSRAGPGSRQFKLSLRSWGTFPTWRGTQNHRWPLVSKILKPSKNHWKQWSGGWKSLNGDGWMTPKPLKKHRVQWSDSKRVFNGDGQRVAKPLMPMVLAEKNSITSLPKNDHCSPLVVHGQFSRNSRFSFS